MVALSDAFSAIWEPLATRAGLALRIVPTLPEAESAEVVVLAAGGAEDALPDAVRAIASPGRSIAAVGALTERRLAIAIMRAGASEYCALPEDHELLASWLEDQGRRLNARTARREFGAAERKRYGFAEILGESHTLQSVLERASRIIPHGNVTVLIRGETGTGKELMARAIHYGGPRRDAAFVDVNCAALPESLLESELFGHEKGAFTSATATKPGLFELASGGTLFLDEIGHLPLPLQGKLLRALEERIIRRVGGTKNIPVDVRVIAASHVELGDAVKRGEFREDLYYRLNVVPIEMPSLRSRPEDIPLLAAHFAARFAAEYGLATPVLSPEAVQLLQERRWNGNVRELRNVMERTVLLAGSDVLRPEHFDDGAPPSAPAPAQLPFPATMTEIEIAAARSMLERCAGNKSEAARRLGISRTRLQRLLAGDAGSSDD